MTKTFRFILSALMLSWLLTLIGCDRVATGELKPGASVDDIQKKMGKPDTVRPAGAGHELWEYPLGPNGTRTYFMLIGPDKTLKEIRNVLTEDTFRQISAGMTQIEVRDLIGKPRTKTPYPMKQEEVWEWKYLMPPSQDMLLWVVFDKDGKVLRTERNDPSLYTGR